MNEDRPVRHYRIGEYAQKMGVTPDLLKHYEKMGLIRARTTESGYRYYAFPESVPLLECLALRNYQMPLLEMRQVLYEGDLPGYRAALSEKAEAIHRRVLLEQAVLAEFEAEENWMARMEGRSLYLLIEEREDVYFLPHSKRHEFLDDERIQAILPAWLEWMPMVKSTRKIPLRPEGDGLAESAWGLSVPVPQAEKFGLPLNGAVEIIPGGRQTVVHYRLEEAAGQTIRQAWAQVQARLREQPLPHRGVALQTVFASLFSPGQAVHCGAFSVPLEE